MPYTEAGYKAAKKYREQNIKRIPLDIQKSDYDTIKAHAESCGETVNGFIKRALRETMQRDDQKNPAP